MKTIFGIGMIFLFGFLSANLVNYYLVYGLETPFSDNFGLFSRGFDIDSAPSDFVDEEQIDVYDDKIVINIGGVSLSRYAPTGSMRPVLDYGSTGIRIVPEGESDINKGDIITFRDDSLLIVHRVVEKGIDSEGVYFITKGDNNSVSDGKIRFEDIEYLTVGVIW